MKGSDSTDVELGLYPHEYCFFARAQLWREPDARLSGGKCMTSSVSQAEKLRSEPAAEKRSPSPPPGAKPIPLNQAAEKPRFDTSVLPSVLEDSTTISVICTDLEQNVLYWNRGAEEIFGYPSDQMVGNKISVLYMNDRQARVSLDRAREKMLATGKGTTCELMERARDGRSLWVKLNLMPRFDDSGEIVGMVGIGQEITELKKAEKKLGYSLKKLRRAVGGTIHAMALTVEKRDPYTAGHQRRATDLARAIADEMGLPKDIIDGIRMAGVIHDMGKVYVPADILNKPGKLTRDEFMLIRRHPEAGYDIVKYVEFPWPIGQIVLQHHERLNGSGYPNGLKGREICLEARIVAVADVVESMASHRPYRPALGIDRALEEIQSQSGILYDPDVVECCARLFHQKKYALIARDGLL